MQIKFLKGPRAGEILDLPDSGAIFGRGEDCEAVLEDEAASRQHARLTHPGNRYVIDDLGSTNGVYVNDKRIAEPKTVYPGDRIAIGSSLFIVVGSERDEQETMPPIGRDGKPLPEPSAETTGEPRGPREVSSEGGGIVWIVLGLVVALLIAGAAAVWIVFGEDTTGPRPVGGDIGTPLTQDADPFAEPEPAEPPAAGPTSATEPAPDGGGQAAAPAIRVPDHYDFLWLDSVPPGARVRRGDEELGRTPLLVEDLESGTHTFTFSLDGFEPLEREFATPGDGTRRVVALDQQPGTCRITSEPSGAAVFHGRQLLGRTPLILRDMTPGEYPVRVRLPGYTETPVNAVIDPARPFAITARLEPQFGILELRTTPPEARVYIDGEDRGQTRPADDDSVVSRPLTLAGFAPGPIEVTIEYRDERSEARVVELQAGQVEKLHLTLWLPDTRIETRAGETVDGMLVGRNDDGDVRLLLSNGTERLVRAGDIEDSLVLPLALGRELRAAARRRDEGGD